MDTRTILLTLAMAVLTALGAAACQGPAVQAAREKTDDPKLTARQILSMDDENLPHQRGENCGPTEDACHDGTGKKPGFRCP